MLAVAAIEGHRIWSSTYDASPNALLALDMRVVAERLGPLEGLRVVDIGCGTGRWTAYACEQGAIAIGVDACDEMLRAAARKSSIAHSLILAEASSLPVRNSAADLALCSFAFSYFPNPTLALSEMTRVTRPGGRVVVSDLHGAAIEAGWKRTFRSGDNVYELKHFSHSTRHLKSTAKQLGLQLDWEISVCLGQPELAIFQEAGKEELFEKASRVSALCALSWTRP
jgi:malonyl-CoA O-methyltransferase